MRMNSCVPGMGGYAVIGNFLLGCFISYIVSLSVNQEDKEANPVRGLAVAKKAGLSCALLAPGPADTSGGQSSDLTSVRGRCDLALCPLKQSLLTFAMCAPRGSVRRLCPSRAGQGTGAADHNGVQTEAIKRHNYRYS